MQPKYTEKESKLFTGRTSYIEQIEKSISKNNVAALLAHSGFGRTSLLRRLAAKTGALQIDLRKLSLSPENFAVEFIGTVSFLNIAKEPSEFAEYLTIEKLKQLKLGKGCKDLISKVDNELQKIKPDQDLLLKSAFTFAEEFALEKDKRFTISLNNFDELLKLNNFSQISDVLGLFFDSIARNKSCSFILSSSNVHNMKGLLKKFIPDVIEMSSFSPGETKELFEKITGKADDRIIKEVHSLSAGIPLIIKSIARRFKEEKTADIQKNIRLVKYTRVSDLATITSRPYSYCSRLFTSSVNRARGEALLKTVLKVVSQNRPLRLTEIAKLVYRSGPVTKSLLERLIEADLIIKTDNTFDFANPVLKQWCSLVFSGIEFSETPDERTLTEAGGMR